MCAKGYGCDKEEICFAAAAAAWEIGVKHLSSNNIVCDKYTSMKIILTLLSSALTQLFANK